MTIDTVRGAGRALRWGLTSGECDMTRPLTFAVGDGAQARTTGDPYPSTYVPIASPPVLISGATVLTGTGTRLDGADVLLRDGKVAAVGSGLAAPAGAVRVDGGGKWVTPGLIDIH